MAKRTAIADDDDWDDSPPGSGRLRTRIKAKRLLQQQDREYRAGVALVEPEIRREVDAEYGAGWRDWSVRFNELAAKVCFKWPESIKRAEGEQDDARLKALRAERLRDVNALAEHLLIGRVCPACHGEAPTTCETCHGTRTLTGRPWSKTGGRFATLALDHTTQRALANIRRAERAEYQATTCRWVKPLKHDDLDVVILRDALTTVLSSWNPNDRLSDDQTRLHRRGEGFEKHRGLWALKVEIEARVERALLGQAALLADKYAKPLTVDRDDEERRDVMPWSDMWIGGTRLLPLPRSPRKSDVQPKAARPTCSVIRRGDDFDMFCQRQIARIVDRSFYDGKKPRKASARLVGERLIKPQIAATRTAAVSFRCRPVPAYVLPDDVQNDGMVRRLVGQDRHSRSCPCADCVADRLTQRLEHRFEPADIYQKRAWWKALSPEAFSQQAHIEAARRHGGPFPECDVIEVVPSPLSELWERENRVDRDVTVQTNHGYELYAIFGGRGHAFCGHARPSEWWSEQARGSHDTRERRARGSDARINARWRQRVVTDEQAIEAVARVLLDAAREKARRYLELKINDETLSDAEGARLADTTREYLRKARAHLAKHPQVAALLALHGLSQHRHKP